MSLKSKIKLQCAILKMLMEPDKNLKAKAAARVEKLSKQLST